MGINFENAKKGRSEMTVEIRAPIERVFEAFTNARDLSEWLHAGYESDPREGGKFRFGGKDIGGPRSGEFLTVKPPHLLVFSWRWNPMDDAHPDPQPHWTDKEPTKVTVELTKKGDLTHVRLVHDGFKEIDEQYWSYSLGWEMLAGKYMKYYLEHGADAAATWWEKEGPTVQEQFAKDLERAMSGMKA